MRENRRLPKEKKLTKTIIAKMMGIRRSTLYRELKRGEVDSVFKIYTIHSSNLAQSDYEKKATNKEKDHRLANYIEKDVFLQITNKDLPRQGIRKNRRYQRIRKRALQSLNALKKLIHENK